jgi:hypothetical protein
LRKTPVVLFEPERHEALTHEAWDETRARDAVERIVFDAHEAYGGVDRLWPIHPIDVSDERPPILLALYNGAAGVVWALNRLDAARRDYLPAIATLLARNRADNLRLANRSLPSFALGDTGILFLHWLLAPAEKLVQQLGRAIESNFEHPSNGFAWGAPGTMRAALFLYERTGDERWADLFRRNADILWRGWHWHESSRCHLWTQDLYGEKAHQLGALHGFAGNALVLLTGRSLLSQNRRDELVARVRETLLRTALREGAHANWELCARPSVHPGMRNIRVQHCTGAPGMINTLSFLPADPETDALFLAAGELVWDAGPPVKIPSLCHGTPGSGYAFLKLYARTGDAKWLSRARAFAMHAIAQNERFVMHYGQRKYSLWTGDLGLAIYLRACIEGAMHIPLYDVF